MRTQSLRKFANRQIKMDKQGKFEYRKHRTYVIHKMIDDLFVIRQVPSSWQVLKAEHVYKLVQYWKKRHINPVTIMRYMTIIRRFLQMSDCQIDKIDNQSLNLTRPKPKRRRNKGISPDMWQSMDNPYARVIMAFQVEFGLTFQEAIRIKSYLHVKQDGLWITRDIAFNSSDRCILLRTEKQKTVLQFFNWLTNDHDNLIKQKSYEELRLLWRSALARLC